MVNAIGFSASVQEDTTDADKKVASAVDDLKGLKAALAEAEAEMEKVTGVPRNKEAFRESVVRIAHLRWTKASAAA